MAKAELQHWVRTTKTRTAWCGVKVPDTTRAMPWPITCKKCCVAIRKSRLRLVELETRPTRKLSLKLKKERDALLALNWPQRPPSANISVSPARGAKTTVLASATRSRGWPDDCTFTKQDVEQIIKYLRHDASKDLLSRLWLSDDEEKRILDALEAFSPASTYRPKQPDRPVHAPN